MKKLLMLIGLILGLGVPVVRPQPPLDHVVPTNSTGPHYRIRQTDLPGRRVEMATLKGTRLFINSGVKVNKPVPLIVHFHGASWLIEYHVAKYRPDAILITVQLGAGSRAYGLPFDRAEVFQSLVDEASQFARLKRGWSSITLSGFSAGYGSVREILRHNKNYELVNNVLLLDGIHASYLPDGRPLSDGGAVDAADLDAFLAFARDAVKKKKTFVITHSEITPASYASTTECADYLVKAVNAVRQPIVRSGPNGMPQLSSVNKGRLTVLGYSGDAAPDHIDHLHSMGEWFGLLDMK